MGLRGKRGIATIVADTDWRQTKAKLSVRGDTAKEAGADED